MRRFQTARFQNGINQATSCRWTTEVHLQIVLQIGTFILAVNLKVPIKEFRLHVLLLTRVGYTDGLRQLERRFKLIDLQALVFDN
jgi:hypothetical protein